VNGRGGRRSGKNLVRKQTITCGIRFQRTKRLARDRNSRDWHEPLVSSETNVTADKSERTRACQKARAQHHRKNLKHNKAEKQVSYAEYHAWGARRVSTEGSNAKQKDVDGRNATLHVAATDVGEGSKVGAGLALAVLPRVHESWGSSERGLKPEAPFATEGQGNSATGGWPSVSSEMSAPWEQGLIP